MFFIRVRFPFSSPSVLVRQLVRSVRSSFVLQFSSSSRVLLFPTFVSFHRFLIRFQFSFTHIVRQKLFLVFSFESLRGKSARGWPEFISSCMPDVSLSPSPSPMKITSPRDEERRNWERFWVARRLTNCLEWRTI